MSSSPWGDMSVQPQGQLIIFAMICVCKSFVYIFLPDIAHYGYIAWRFWNTIVQKNERCIMYYVTYTIVDGKNLYSLVELQYYQYHFQQ